MRDPKKSPTHAVNPRRLAIERECFGVGWWNKLWNKRSWKAGTI
jgi:hypothetical protein